MNAQSLPSRLLVLLAAVALALLSAGVASAALCNSPPPLERAIRDAKFVFVGTVTSTAYRDLVATFTVEDVWKGDVGQSVRVNGAGQPLAALEEAESGGAGVTASFERTYQRGERYLVVSHAASGGALEDHSCSATQPFTSRLRSYAPAEAGDAAAEAAATPTAALPPEGSADGPSSLLALGLGLTLGATAGTAAIRRRRRTRGAPDR